MERVLVDRATRWVSLDPDPADRQLVERWLAERDAGELKEAFSSSLEFGTAGLRGPVGPGSARMNVLQVHRVSWAVADYLSTLGHRARPLVIGYDARLQSEHYAAVAATTFVECGFSVVLARQPVPTPVIAFSVLELGAAAGVVITASHNPRGDNGFKLYDGEGIQIVPPWDQEIARRMDSAPGFPVSLEDATSASAVLSKKGCDPLSEEVLESYLASARAVFRLWGGEAQTVGSEPTRWRVAYTPVHGVGRFWAERVVAGRSVELMTVPEQAEPDGDFPTTPFPNPEEPGVMDRVIHLAESCGAELAIAHDPDADRIAICLPDDEGRFERLGGDELGALFADCILETRRKKSSTCVSSIVSSPLLDAIASEYGAKVVRTLTGFKWICRAALEHDDFVFGYEEALGYCFVPPPGYGSVRDKDGLTALSALIALLELHGGGRGLRKRLFSIYERHGLFVSRGHSVRFSGPDAARKMRAAMNGLRARSPTAVGDMAVLQWNDFGRGSSERPVYLGHQDLLECQLERGQKILVRPSGTEPKVKCYLHLAAQLDESQSLTALRSQLEVRASALGAELERILQSGVS